MFDFVCKVGGNEAFLTEGAGLFVAFEVSHHEFHFLCNVHALLVILVVAMEVCKKSPVIEVIDCVFEEGICCLVAPKATTEPGGEQLHWFVSGIIGRGI